MIACSKHLQFNSKGPLLNSKAGILSIKVFDEYSFIYQPTGNAKTFVVFSNSFKQLLIEPITSSILHLGII